MGGGTVAVSESSFTNLVADLGLPTFTLLPGQTMYISFQVDVSAQRNSSADFLFNGHGAQLWWKLPAGVTLDTDATAPLVWISVPEPNLLPMLAAGGIALVGWAGRGKRRQLDDTRSSSIRDRPPRCTRCCRGSVRR